jgi:hypothetical protein
MVYAGNRAASFDEASDALLELAEASISAERVRRACGHVGHDLIDEQRQLQEAYQAKPLPEQATCKPADATTPEIACVMADGGRYQRLDRPRGEAPCGENRGANKCGSARKGKHWKESRIALLAKMSSVQHDVDPQPELPPSLRYAVAAEKLGEIGKTGRKLEESESDPADDDSPIEAELAAHCEPLSAIREHGRFARESATLLEPLPDSSRPLEELGVAGEIAAREMAAAEVDTPGVVGPKLKERSVVASRCDWREFGPLVASQAWYRGFAAATRKVFVSDGSATIEKLQRRHFSHYTSVLDLLHALSYALAAARAVSVDEATAEQQYDAWAAMIWSGRVAEVIRELAGHGQRLGLPPSHARESDHDPGEVVRRSRVFFENHQSRMDYPNFRRQGFPLTSSLMESTVKQVSRRVKGSEKFWSSSGAEAMLRLRGASLSEDKPLDRYFNHRTCHARGTRAYRHKPPLAVNT